VTGDRYAGRWPCDEFAKHGIDCETAELDHSGLYVEALSAINSGRVELPPCRTMTRQLEALERRTSRSGRDTIAHPPGGHDDRANAAAGVVALAIKTVRRTTFRSVPMRVLGGRPKQTLGSCTFSGMDYLRGTHQ
jgi:hypothetical protein